MKFLKKFKQLFEQHANPGNTINVPKLPPMKKKLFLLICGHELKITNRANFKSITGNISLQENFEHGYWRTSVYDTYESAFEAVKTKSIIGFAELHNMQAEDEPEYAHENIDINLEAIEKIKKATTLEEIYKIEEEYLGVELPSYVISEIAYVSNIFEGDITPLDL